MLVRWQSNTYLFRDLSLSLFPLLLFSFQAGAWWYQPSIKDQRGMFTNDCLSSLLTLPAVCFDMIFLLVSCEFLLCMVFNRRALFSLSLWYTVRACVCVCGMCVCACVRVCVCVYVFFCLFPCLSVQATRLTRLMFVLSWCYVLVCVPCLHMLCILAAGICWPWWKGKVRI